MNVAQCCYKCTDGIDGIDISIAMFAKSTYGANNGIGDACCIANIMDCHRLPSGGSKIISLFHHCIIMRIELLQNISRIENAVPVTLYSKVTK